MILATYNGNEVLYCKNAIFSALHNNIRAVIEENCIKINQPIEKALDESDQEIFGAGSIRQRFLENITSKKEMLIFADIVRRALVRWQNEITNLPESYLAHGLKFHKNLLKIAQTLD